MADRGRVTAKRSASDRRSRAVPAVRRLSRYAQHASLSGKGAVGPAILQPALKVGVADDPLEREAETMAERVVAMPSPSALADVAPADAGGGTGDARRASIDDQPNTDELEIDPPVPEDHQDPEVPPQEDVTPEDLTAGDMKELEAGDPADTGGDPPLAEAPPPPGDEVALPARDGAVIGPQGGPAPPDVSQRVAQPGSGRPIPDGLRAFMEPRFGRDFSAVRIHDSAQDRQAARRIGARAFTHREHIWIGPGESVEDRKLLAHELTHVVQQAAPGPSRALERSVDAHKEAGEPQVRRGYIRNKAEKYARNVPGYRLISVIIGRSPITGDKVERNAVNLLGAMMSLIPGGNLLFERLEESRALQEAFDWVSGRLSSLNITWTRIKGLISDLIDYMPDWPSDMIAYAKKLFRPLVDDILTFIREVTEKILEFIVRGALKIAGPWAERVWEVIKAAGSVLSKILKDPLGFAKNLFSAVLKGFRQFGGHILTHIKKGLLGWLFGAIRGLDIQIPEKLDFKGLISIGLQIVGLTYAHFRALLVKRLGANGERKVTFLEKSVEAVKILVKEGFVGLWQRALQMIDNFRDTVIGGIRSFVIDTLIMGGLSWLAGLSNPVGAIIKVVLAIYNLVKTFLERLDQILEVVGSIFSSIGAIAAGRIQEAADFIERTLAATIPVVISFLAALVPVTGITKAIRNLISRLRGAVERALERMITFVVKKAKKLFSKLIAKLNSKRKLPSANFTFGRRQHRIYAERREKKIEVMIASGAGHTVSDVSRASAEEAKKLKDKAAVAEAGQITAEVKEADKETARKAKTLKPDSQKDNQLKGFAALEAELEEAGAELQEAGADTANYPEIDTEQAQYLFRAKEPRFEDVEGTADEYSALGKITSQVIKLGGAEDPAKRRYSDFYENDHIPEKQFPQAILSNIDLFRAGGGDQLDRDSEKAEAAPSEQEAAKPAVGKLGDSMTAIPKDGTGLPAMTIYRPVHIAKKSTPPAEVSARVEAASKKPDPIGAVKTLVSDEIKLEAGKVVEIVRKDASASDAIRSKIDAGIAGLIASNTSLYELDKVDEPQKAAAPGAKPDASLSKLPFEGDEKRGIPNFLEVEGQYKPHGSFDKGYGKYLEYDHVIDAAWPRYTQGISFGHPKLKEKLDARLKSAKLDTSDKRLRNRLSSLGEKKIFRARQGMAKYAAKTGHAIAVYRPVHRAVTRQASGPRDDSLPVAAITGSFVEPLVKFVETGDLAELKTARDKAQSDLKPLFTRKTENHLDLIAEQYVHELRAVKKINKKMESAAQQSMIRISGSVRDSLQKARSNTTELF
jgi:hypothetical protein